MIYALSDLHGCGELYRKMLDVIHFSKNDTLYILGDCIDRGPDGIAILQDMMNHPNVIPLRGNHEATAIRLLRMLDMPTKPWMDDDIKRLFQLWFVDGGDSTFKAFRALKKEERTKLLRYLNSFSVFEEVEVNGRSFFLSHTVPERERMLDLDTCSTNDFLLGEPDYELVYFPDKFLLTGHTPTDFIDPDYQGRIYCKNNHIALDCGAVFHGRLGCICLDTLEEFYAD